MTSVVILGYGNVGKHLCSGFHKASDVTVKQVYNRKSIRLTSEVKEIPFTTDLTALETADVYIIAIPDDAITSFSEGIPLKDALVVHTSGSVPMEILADKNRKGVFYPLQTFSKASKVDFADIPICIEAEKPSDLQLLRKLGNALSKKVVEISSEERAKLHLSAVFVNNFVNHLYYMSEAYLNENHIDFDLLKPLIAETARKMEHLTPTKAQTGPAKRNDQKTIEKHLKLMGPSPMATLYKQFTDAIQRTTKSKSN